MIGIGTLINTGAVILGGLFGHFFGRFLQPRYQESLNMVCGVSVLFIGIGGAMQGMLTYDGTGLVSGKAMFIVLSLVVGVLIGEIFNIERGFERLGEWLKQHTGNAKDPRFIYGFLTATFTVCIGAMAIVGAIQDGISGNWTLLATKSVLDLVIVMVMTSAMGRGPIFSAVPIFLFEGSITLLAAMIGPFLNDLALANISLVGSILIFCVGINLVWGNKIRVANMLPALFLAIVVAYI